MYLAVLDELKIVVATFRAQTPETRTKLRLHPCNEFGGDIQAAHYETKL